VITTRKRDISLRVKMKDLNVILSLMQDMEEDLSERETRTFERLYSMVSRADWAFEERRKGQRRRDTTRSSNKTKRPV